jgi:hypothetical protein
MQVNAASAAAQLAARLEARGVDYALGGAIALGYWGVPRGTVDVDLTLYLAPEQPSACAWLLKDIGCDVQSAETMEALRAHGFCSVSYAGLRLDVFLPIVPFYEEARKRRKRVQIGGQPFMVWDGESLLVFKMMFFRRKDLADVEQILRSQGGLLDRCWVRERLAEMYGAADPRLSAWDEIARDTHG